MTIRKASLILNICLCIGMAIIFCCFMLYAKAASNIENTMANKEICLALGEELRESSKDLTRNVRLYAASGDSRFESAYKEILDERSGRIPRASSRQYFPNEKHSLVDLLKRYGISDVELGYIQTASILSDDLVPLEIEAMNAVKGIFKDQYGQYTIHGKPDKNHAMELVFGANYDKYTAPIMRNMDKFAETLLARLNKIVDRAQREEKIYQTIFLASISLMLVLVLFSIFYSNRTVIEPLVKTSNFSLTLASGDYNQRIKVKSDNEIGQLRNVLNYMADQINQFKNRENSGPSAINCQTVTDSPDSGSKDG